MANLEKYNARRGKVLINHLIQDLQIGFNKAARQLHIETQEEGRGRIAKRGSGGINMNQKRGQYNSK